MKALELETQDAREIQDLGRASVQIVHDLKNQLNGLKLYATFLRKRLEKSARPVDEIETVVKLIAGLERAAGDMTVLVRYGRRVELRLQPKANLIRILQAAFGNSTIVFAGDEEQFSGALDAEALGEAFRSIGEGVQRPAGEVRLRLVRDETSGERDALIEWESAQAGDADPFQGFAGSHGLRLALAAKIFRAHGGQAGRADGAPSVLQVRLPLKEAEER